jgi:hypothetical protein
MSQSDNDKKEEEANNDDFPYSCHGNKNFVYTLIFGKL